MRFSTKAFVLFILLKILSKSSVLCEEYYIAPIENCSAFETSCLTLSVLAYNLSNYITANTTLVFLENHTVTLEVPFSVSDVAYFSMISDGISSITCSNGANFTFLNVNKIYIKGLTFTACGGNKVDSVNEVTIEHSNFQGRKRSRSALIIAESNVEIIGTSFVLNEFGSYHTSLKFFESLGLNFLSDTARVGGAIIANRSNISIDTCHFEANKANIGGAIFSELNSSINISNSVFISNQATACNNRLCFGGSLFVNHGVTMYLHNCTFDNNTSTGYGGVGAAFNATIIISQSSISGNIAFQYGGVVALFYQSSILVHNSMFEKNIAHEFGGVVYAENASSAVLDNSMFTENSATDFGGTVYATTQSRVIYTGNCTVTFNSAKSGGVLYATDNTNAMIINSNFNSNRADSDDRSIILSEGGVAYLNNNSTILIQGSNFNSNSAVGGGGVIAIIQSNKDHLSLIINSTFTSNTANDYGGAIHLRYGCNIQVNGSTFVNNSALINGGMFDAYICCAVEIHQCMFYNNSAARDGGTVANLTVSFTLNKANFGGAVFVNDGSESSLCSSDPLYSNVSLCFIQAMLDHLSVNFYNNSANFSGDNLYGGLLDRCKAITTNNLSTAGQTGALNSNLLEITNIRDPSTISSKPVRVCPCNGNLVDCSRRIYNISITIGDMFTLPLAAVDQVEHPVVATVILSSSNNLTLSETQRIEGIDAACSNLTYHVFFPNTSQQYTLSIHADGPCNSKGISKLIINVHVNDCFCGIGFMRDTSSTRCSCVCDSRNKLFSTYVQDCDQDSESIVRNKNFWISALENGANNSYQQYFIHPFCPRDYCKLPSESVLVNLNLPDGSDSQCANNRAGFLCGECMSNYSLSLGSSKCIKCPNNWYAHAVDSYYLGSFHCWYSSCSLSLGAQSHCGCWIAQLHYLLRQYP